MADIFISYKREDEEEKGRVTPIADALRAEGYDVFYDVQVPPGSSWEAFLQSKIDAARVVLVLWSQHSVTSDWVKEEAEMAKSSGKLIPVFLDTVAPPFGFARIEGANLANWDGDLQHVEWRNLVAALKSRIGDGEAAPEPSITRVPYSSAPAKTVEVTKTAPSGGGSAVTKWVVGLVTVAAVAALGLFAWGSLRQADRMDDQAATAATDRAMTRQIDENAWRDARAGGTIADYRRYLDLRPTGAYRADALEAIEQLEAEAAARATPPPSQAQPSTPDPAGPADLRIASLSLGASEVQTGGTLRARVEVANVGDVAAPGSDASGYMIDFVLSRDASAPVRWASFSETWSEDAMPRGGRTSNTREIPPGSTQAYTTSMTLPGDWPAGRFNLCAIADPGGVVEERSEANNTACTPLQVLAAPNETGNVLLVNGVTIEVADVQPSRGTISLTRQDFAVTFDYVVPLGRRMDILVQPTYSGPGTCRWSAESQPGILAGSGRQTVRFRFTGAECANKTLTAVSFRVAPQDDGSDWQLAEHPLRFGME